MASTLKCAMNFPLLVLLIWSDPSSLLYAFACQAFLNIPIPLEKDKFLFSIVTHTLSLSYYPLARQGDIFMETTTQAN